MRLDRLSAFLAAITAAGVSALEAPIPGYKVFVPQWEVAASPGGETVFLNGTIEQVVDQLREVDPDFREPDWLNSTAEDAPVLAKRADFHGAEVICNIFEDAKRTPVLTGIGYLRGVHGQPVMGAGPGSCSRVSCSYKASIWWCNQTTGMKYLGSFGDIADGATKILDTCRGGEINGQVTHVREGWSVIVQGARDC